MKTEQDYRFNVVKGIEQQAPVVELGDRIVHVEQHNRLLAEPVDVFSAGRSG